MNKFTLDEKKDMSVFIFDGHSIRTSGTPDNPMFVAKDVCAALGIENHRDLLAKAIPEDEKGVARIYSPGGPQEMLTVTESGLYRLIFRSDKPEAKRFQDWVCKEVLPQIRQTARFQWLREAYHLGKTGKVQLVILRELGIVTCQTGTNEVASRAYSLGPCFDIGEFWTAVDQGFAAKPRPEAFRLRQHQDCWHLYLLPNEVLELAGGAAEKFQNVSTYALREHLAPQQEWVNGEFRKRFGGKARTPSIRWAWALVVTKNSPDGLQKLIDRLLACPEREKLMMKYGRAKRYWLVKSSNEFAPTEH